MGGENQVQHNSMLHMYTLPPHTQDKCKNEYKVREKQVGAISHLNVNPGYLMSLLLLLRIQVGSGSGTQVVCV